MDVVDTRKDGDGLDRVYCDDRRRETVVDAADAASGMSAGVMWYTPRRLGIGLTREGGRWRTESTLFRESEFARRRE